MKVLVYIADDDRAKREIIVGMVLEAAKAVSESSKDSLEVEIFQFTCGNDVIEAVSQQEPDLLISDWSMEPGTGLDVVKTLWESVFALLVVSGESLFSIHKQVFNELGLTAFEALEDKIFYTPGDTKKFTEAVQALFQGLLP